MVYFYDNTILMGDYTTFYFLICDIYKNKQRTHLRLIRCL